MRKLFTFFACIALLGLSFSAFAQKNGDLENAKSLLKRTQQTIQFTENKGQWKEGYILFAGTSAYGHTVIRRDEITFMTYKQEDYDLRLDHGQSVQKWAMKFHGHNRNFEVVKGKSFETVRNYMVGDPSTFATGVVSYDELTLKNLYPGIDLRIYSQPKGNLEFDWIVAPGADFSKVDVEYDGVNNVKIADDGSLNIGLEFTDLKYRIPECYQIQNGKKINKRFAFKIENGKHVRFGTKDKIDPTLPTVIDPELVWGIYFDSNTTGFDEYLFAVDYDNARNIYCVGKTNAAFPAGYITTGATGFNQTYVGGRDVVIYKIRWDGKVILAFTYFGTSANDNGYSISLSPDKSTLFVGGSVGAAISASPTTSPLVSSYQGGTYDGFVAVFDAATISSLKYYTLIGSVNGSTIVGTGSGDFNSVEGVFSIVATSNTDFVVGATVEGAVPSAFIGNAAQSTYSTPATGTSSDMYIGKFSNYKTLTFGTYCGGAGVENLNDLAVFSDGGVAFTGESASGVFSTNNNASTGSSGTDLDGVVGVIPSTGGAYTQLSKIGSSAAGTGGTSANDAFFGISIGFFDTLLITGYTGSATFPLGPGASAATRFQNTFNGGARDAIVGKVPRTGGSGTWQATYIGGAGDDLGNSLRAYTPYAVMMYGESTSSGATYPTAFPTKNVTSGPTTFFSSTNHSTNTNGWDMVFFTLGSDLKTNYFSTYIGGENNDYLGATGVPRGSNQFKVMGDSSIVVGTTSHSQSNFLPTFIGLGTGGTAMGITTPLFDVAKSNTNNDSHIIYEWNIKSLLNFEYGDAPLSYGTPKSNIVGSIKIGTLIDGEDKYPVAPGKRANVDDNTTSDDEDGISGSSISLSRLNTTYTTPSIPVTNSTGVSAKLIGFIDFNGNGTFESTEAASVSVPTGGATTVNLTWSGFTVTSATDTIYLRLRLTTDTSVTNRPSATKDQSNGEIEDYLVLLNCPTITVNITPSATSVCSGQPVTLTGSASGASNSFTWSWSPGGATTSTITPSPTVTTIYTLTAKDVATGCTANKQQIITVNPTPTIGSISGSNPTTCGGSSGSITITGLVPATGSYTITYTKNAANQTYSATAAGGIITIPNLTAGTYTSFIASQNSCNSLTNSTSIVLTDPSGPTGTISGPATGCANASLGAYSVTSLSNCSSCTYLWSATGGATVSTPTASTTNVNFPSGGSQTVSVVVTNSSNCASTLTRTVTVTGIPTISSVSQGSCIGTSASATVNATVNPTATLEYSKDAGTTWQTSNVFASLPNGNYNVIARVQGTTCASTSFAFTISCVCNTVAHATISGNNIVCSGGGTTSLSASLTNSSSGTWIVTSGGGNLSATNCVASGCTTTFTSTTAGTSVVRFITNDPDGVGPCQPDTEFYSITVNQTPNVTLTSISNPTTCGGCDGSITLNGLTANQSFTVTYNGPGGSISGTFTANGSGQIIITNLCVGTYSNIIVTRLGCSSTSVGPLTLNNPAAPTIGGATSTNPTTCLGSNGTITLTGVTPANGTFTISYTKNGVGQSASGTASSGNLSISGLTAGSYANFVITVASCSSNPFAGPVVLTDPTPPSGTISGPATACQGVLTGAYTVPSPLNCNSCSYVWSSSNATPSAPTSASTNFTYNGTGNVTIQVVMTSGTTNCSSTQTKTVGVNGIPVISSVTQGTCVGLSSSITVNASVAPVAALEFSLDGGTYQSSNNFASVANGSHTVTARVQLTACVSSTFNFTINCACSAPPSAIILAPTSNLCTGSLLTLTANINNADSGRWSIVSGGGTLSTTHCTGNGCTTNYSSTTSGTKVVRFVTNDPDGVGPCLPDTASFTITVSQTPTVTSTGSTNPTTCGGSNGTISLNGVLPGGTYTVNYTKNSTPQSTTITASSGTVTITGLTAGSYGNFVLTQNGCSSSIIAGPIVLTDPASPNGNVNGPTPVCIGATTSTYYSVRNLVNCSSCTYAWSSSNGTASTPNVDSSKFTFNSTGNATVQVIITNSTTQCSATLTKTVAINGIPTVSSVAQGSCTGNASPISVNASVTPPAALEYSLDGGTYQSSNTFAAVVDGSHTVTVRVQGTSCASAPFSFTVNCHCTNPATATITGPTTVCTTSNITLTSTITNASNGTWSILSGGGSLSSTNCSATGCTTVYTAGATAGNAIIQFVTNDPDGVGPCTAFTTTKTIKVNQTPVVTSATAHNTTTCGGNDGYIIITGVTPADSTYIVNYLNGSTPQTATIKAVGTTLTISNLSAGTYSNIVITLNGCTSNTASGPFIIVDPTPPSGTVTGPATACQNVVTSSAYSISGLTNCSGCTYVWSSSNGTATTPTASTTTFTFTTTGTQTAAVTITASNNCSSTISMNVAVKGIPVVTGVSLGTCVGFTTTATVNASVNPTAILEYAIDAGAYQSSNVFSGVGNGSHTAFARVVGSSCASTAYSFNVNCNCATPAGISITSISNPICSNSTTTLTATLTNAGSATWSVFSGGGSLSTTSCTGSGCTTVYTPASSGAKVIRVISSDPDGSGPCTPDTVFYTLNVTPTPSFTASASTNPSTCSGNDGKITLTGVSPNGSYSVAYTKNGASQSGSFSAASGTLIISGLTAGTYANIVITQAGCSLTIPGTFVLTDPTPPSGTVTGPAIACIGSTTSTKYILGNINNCNGCTYVWSSAAETPVSPNSDSTAFTFSSTGNQSVQVLMTNPTTQCSTTVSKAVYVNGIPTVSGVTQGSCTGFSASATVNASVTPPAALEYSLDGGAYQTSNVFASVSNGNHTTTVRVQGTTCASNAFTFTINCTCTNPPSVTITGNNTTCAGQQVILSANFTNVSSGTWSIITGGGTLSNLACSGNGCVTVYTPVSGILAPINATIRMTTADPDGVGPCSATFVDQTVTIYPQPKIDTVIGTNPTSCGGCNGSFTIYGLQQNTGYTVNYTGPGGVFSGLVSSNGSGQIIISGLCTGTYTNISVSVNGCTSAAYNSITLSNPPGPILTSNTSTNPTTCGGQDGTITFNVSPAGTYTINYTKGGTPQIFVATSAGGKITINNLTAGTYANFTVTGYGCSSTTLAGPIILTDPSIPNGNVTGPTPVCNGVTASTYAVASLANCSTCGYSWSATGGTPATPTATTTDINFSGLGVQNVQVVLTNTATNCTNTIAKSVMVKGIPAVSSVTIGSCTGLAAPITVNANVAPNDTMLYSLDGSAYQTSNQFANVANGTHQVTVRIKGTTCTSNPFTFVISCSCPLPPSVSINGSNTTCANSTLTLVANLVNVDSGTWSISSGLGTLNTTHCSSNGCTVIFTPNIGITTTQNSIITFTTNDPDGAGPCVPTSSNFVVTIYPIPAIGGVLHTDATSCGACNGTISLSGLKAGQSYTISYIGSGGATSATINANSLGTVIITGLCAGTYSNITASQNGCTSSSVGPITINNPAPPTIGSDSLVNTSTCGGNDGKLILRGITPSTGNFTFTYTKNGAPQSTTGFVTGGYFEITGLTAGSYDNVAVSINNCISTTLTGPFVITDPAPPTGVIAGPNSACFGILQGAYFVNNLTNCNGCTYTWSSTGGSPSSITAPLANFTFTTGGNQTVNLILKSSVTNCSSSLSKVVKVNGIPVINSVVQGTCTGFTANITVNATVTPNAVLEYSLDGGAFQLSNVFASLNVGNHNVVARDTGTVCSSTPPFTFAVTCQCVNIPAANITGNGTTCSNTPVTLTGSFSNATSGTWSVLDTTLGKLSVTTCLSNGCQTLFTPKATAAGIEVIQFVTNDPDGVGPCTPDTALFNLTITQSPTYSTVTAVNPTTCGGSDGYIKITGLNLNGNYIIVYNRNSTPQNATASAVGGVLIIGGLNAGTYSNIIITHNGCAANTINGPYTLLDPTAPFGLVSGPTPVCNGAISTPYTLSSVTHCDSCAYAWSSNAGVAVTPNDSTSKFNFTGTGSSSVQVKLTNQKTQCATTVAEPINIIGVPVVNSVSQGNCTANLANVTVNASVTPNAALEYSLDGNTYQNSNVFNNVPSGTHYVTVRVQGSICASNPYSFQVTCLCTNIPSASISGLTTTCSSQSVSLISNFINATNGTWSIVSGSGKLDTSTIHCNASGCVTTLTPDTSVKIQNYITVGFTTNDPDGAGPCQPFTTTYVVTVNPQPQPTTVVGFNPTKCNLCNGSITISGLAASTGYTVNYSGPSGPYTSLISTNVNGQLTIPNLCVGAYSNISVSLNGCITLVPNVTLSAPDPPSKPAVSSNSPICSGKTLLLFAQGANNATYVWTGPGGFNSTSQNPVISSATTANAGIYCVHQIVNGCVTIDSCINVIVNPTPNISTVVGTNPTTCGGSNGYITLSGLQGSTVYFVQYTSAAGQQNVTISSNVGGQLTIPNLTAGTYNNITVSASHCNSTAVGPIVLADPIPPAAPSITGSSPICSGTTLTLSASGVIGSTFSWTGPKGYTAVGSTITRINAADTMSGIYSVTQTINNCTSPSSVFTILVNKTPSIASVVATDPTSCGVCNGKLAINMGNRSQSFTMSYNGPGGVTTANLTTDTTGVMTLGGLCVGVYNIITATQNNCTSASAGPDTLKNPTSPVMPGASASNPVCSGGTLTLSATGVTGASYYWTGPNGFTSVQKNTQIVGVNLTHTGNYCVHQTVAGCVSADSCVHVNVNQTPAITSFNSTNPTSCGANNGTIILSGLTPNGVFTLKYTSSVNGNNIITNDTATIGGQIIIVGLSAGIYNNISVSTNGCSSASVGSLSLIDPNPPAIPSVTGTTTVCQRNTITLTASGSIGAVFNWIGPNGYTATGSTIRRANADSLMAGTYSVTQTVKGCTSAPTVVTININPVPTVSLSTSKDSICANQTVQLIALYDAQTIGISWFKMPSNTPIASTLLPIIVTPTPADNFYRAVATNIYGCVNRDTIQVHRNLGPTANPDYVVTCEGVNLNIQELSNDTDPEGDVESVTIIKYPRLAVAYVNPNQSISYIPDLYKDGLDTIIYQACNAQCLGQCDTSIIFINVCHVNHPPVANNITVSTIVNTPVAVNVGGSTGDPDGDKLNFTYGSPSVVGTVVSVTGIGAIDVLPPAGFIGTITVPYTVCDITTVAPQPLCASATITIVVDSNFSHHNLPPVASNDFISIKKNTSGTLPILANDNDPNGDPLTPTIIASTKHGTSVLNPNGTVTYTPSTGFVGLDTFTYKVCDNGTPTLCDTAIGVISVTNDTTLKPQPPVAVDDIVKTLENLPVTVAVKNNDSDPHGKILGQPTIIDSTIHGTLVLNPNGTITFTPSPYYRGTDTFTYKICNTDGLCDTAQGIITVVPVNNPPVAKNDTTTIFENSTNNVVAILTNDTDPDGDPLKVSAINQPVNGTVVLNPNGTISYTPNPGFFGTDILTYTVCDITIINPQPLCSQANVYVHVLPINNPPVANTDVATTSLNTPVRINVEGNDIDPDNNLLKKPTINVSPTNGTVSVNADGTITYTPNTGFTGTDSFLYQVCDSTTINPQPLCASAWSYVTVSGNGTGCAVAPIANDDYTATTANVAATINVLTNDNPNTATIHRASNGAHGTTTVSGSAIIYTPANGYVGNDKFLYSIQTGTDCFDTAIVFVTINSSIVNHPPVANPDNVQTGKNQSVLISVQLNDKDPDGNKLTTSIPAGVQQPNHGTVTVNTNGTVTYVPNSGFTGRDSFQYVICDNGIPSLCDTTWVNVLVTTNVHNDAPVANTDDTTATSTQAIVIKVLHNDTDPNSDPIHVIGVTIQPTIGTAILNPDGSITYTPDGIHSGVDSFQYQICDTSIYVPHVLCSIAWDHITVISAKVNHPPVAVNDTVLTPEGTPTIIAVMNNDSDPDGNPIHVTNIGTPVNGTVVLNPNGTITYKPNSGFFGTDVFTYTICDNGIPSLCDQAVVYVNVSPVNNPPLANADVANTSMNTVVKIPVQGNDSDPDNNPLKTNAIVANPAHGTATINADGTISYLPNTGFAGTDNFQYQVCDVTTVNPHPLCSTAIVTVTVDGASCPNAPIANDDYSVTNVGSSDTILVKANDAPAGSLIVNVSKPLHGSVAINGASIIYKSTGSYVGADQFIYTISTGSTCFDTALVFIAINPSLVNHPPVANNDNVKTNVNTAVIVDVQLNDKDPDGNKLTTSIPSAGIAAALHGTPTVNANGTVTYVPNPGFTGRDSFQYLVCDNGGPSLCDTAYVFVLINPTLHNDAPVANTEDTTTSTKQSVVIAVLHNDTDPNSDPIHVTGVTVQPQHGTATLNADGTITYTPNGSYIGLDAFQYQICDTSVYTPHVLCSTAWDHINVLVTKQKLPPVAVNDTATTRVNTAVTLTPLHNDYDPDGDSIHVTQVSQPTNGTVVLNSNGTVTYTPNPGFTGTDVYTYTVCDFGTPVMCAVATDYIVVIPVNHPPVAQNDLASTVAGAPVIVDVEHNDSDPDGNPIKTTSIDSLPKSGTVTIIADNTVKYTPNKGFTGVDSFKYTICDTSAFVPNKLCASAWAYITVNACASAPIAINDSIVVNGLSANIFVQSNDIANGNVLVTTQATAPLHGTVLIIPNGSIKYTATPGYSGADQFSYTVCATSGTKSCCASATVYITVAPVNHPPVANKDITTTQKNVMQLIDVLQNDNDPDNNPVKVTGTTAPVHGSIVLNVNGTINYLPNFNFTGLDSFHYTICDTSALLPHSLCSTTVVYILVSDSTHNNPPKANPDHATTIMNNSVTITQISNDVDPDGNPIHTTSIGTPTKGTAVLNANGTITYTPNTGFIGTDSVPYTICDTSILIPHVLCNQGWVYITVNPAAPIEARPDRDTTQEDHLVVIPVLGNDATSGNPVTVSVSTNPSNGTATVNANGTITYNPAHNFNGVDTFIYQLCYASSSVCDTAIVFVTVVQVNDKPVAVDDTVTTKPNTPVVINVKANDHDPDKTNNFPEGNILTTGLPNGIAKPVSGVVSLNANGTVTYVPNLGFIGSDKFQYVICDNGTPTLCDTAWVYITIKINSAPVANTDYDTTLEDISLITTNINLNDTANSANMTNTITSNPKHGAAVLNSNGTIVYTPNHNYNGNDTLVYSYCATATASCDTAMVIITIIPVNDPIVAVNDTTYGYLVNPITTQNVGLNDIDPDGPQKIITLPAGLATPKNGNVVNNNNGTFTWLRNGGFIGTGIVDSFQYQVCDGGNPNYCDTAWVFIVVPNCALRADAGHYQRVCLGNSINIGGSPNTAINGSGNYTYNWTSTNFDVIPAVANPSVTPTVNTTYTVVVVDNSSGCIASDTVSVVINPTPTITFTLDSVYCSSSGMQLLIASPSGGTFSGSGVVLSAGKYYFNPFVAPLDTPLTITYIYTNNGCVYSAANSVIVNSSPKANAGTDVTICPVQGTNSTQLQATGGASYSWFPSFGLNATNISNPIASPGVTTTYIVTVKLNNCSVTDTVVVKVCTDTIPKVIANEDGAVTNVNTSVLINVINNDYSSIGLNNVSITVVDSTNHGKITVVNHQISYAPDSGYIGHDTLIYQLCDTFGIQSYCDTAFVIITVRPQANNDIFPDTLTCDGFNKDVTANDGVGKGNMVSIRIITQPLHGTASINGTSIIYKPEQGYEGADNIMYELGVNGLLDTAQVIFDVNCPKNPCDFPTGFSPNGDGTNDYYVINCPEANPNKSEITIFNRWGNEVFHVSGGYKNNWDGTYRGQPLPDGTYYYIFKYHDDLNADKTGFIVIHR